MPRFPSIHREIAAHRRGIWNFSCVLVALALLQTVAAYGQIVGGHVRMPDPYPPPHQDRLRSLTDAEELQTQPGGRYLLKVAKIQTFRETGPTNVEMIIEAPACLWDNASHNASSAGPLVINSGDGRMHVEGEGFFLQSGSNSTLTISNKVRTILKGQLPGQLSAASETNASLTPTAAADSSAADHVVRIQSDSFHLEHDTNADVITYTGNVRADDDQMDLTSERLTIHRFPDGKIDRIDADQHVTFNSKKEGGGRATGEHSVFTGTGGRELVELRGNPRWEDGTNEATGLVFIFDNVNHTLRIEGQAYLKMRRDLIGEQGLGFAPADVPPKNAPSGAVSFLEIYSESMLFQFPPTKGPVQSVLAEGKVLILDPDTRSRATCGRALASAVTGRLELTGNAIWQADERMARGGMLVFDRERNFSARTNAYLKFPATALGRVIPSGSSGSLDAGARTNQFIEVLAEAYDFAENVLTIRGQVRAAFVMGETIRGALDCAKLTVTFVNTNQLQSLMAEQDVYARQLPFLDPGGRRLERELKTDLLTVRMWPNGFVEEIAAQHHVAGTQTETPAGTGKSVVMTLRSDLLSARFSPTTNRVESALADHDVLITRDDMTATGSKAVYTATNDVVRLLGNAVVTQPNRKWSADEVAVEHGTGTIIGHKNNKFSFSVPATKPKAGKAPAKPTP